MVGLCTGLLPSSGRFTALCMSPECIYSVILYTCTYVYTYIHTYTYCVPQQMSIDSLRMYVRTYMCACVCGQPACKSYLYSLTVLFMYVCIYVHVPGDPEHECIWVIHVNWCFCVSAYVLGYVLDGIPCLDGDWMSPAQQMAWLFGSEWKPSIIIIIKVRTYSMYVCMWLQSAFFTVKMVPL